MAFGQVTHWLTPTQKKLVLDHVKATERISEQLKTGNMNAVHESWFVAHDSFVASMAANMTQEQAARAREIPKAHRSKTWFRHEVQRILGIPDPLEERFEPVWRPL